MATLGDFHAEVQVAMDPLAMQPIAEALDLLGLALCDHGHQWTNAERRAYERAHRLLKGRGLSVESREQGANP